MGYDFKVDQIVDPKAIEEVNKLGVAFEGAMTKYVALTKELAGGVKVNPGSIAEYTRKHEETIATMQKMAAVQNELSTIQEKHAKVLEQASKKIADFGQLSTLIKSMNSFTSSVDKATESLNKIATSTKKVEEAQTSGRDTATAYAKSFQEASNNIGLASDEYAKIIQSVTAFDEKASELSVRLINQKSQLESVRNELKTLKKELDNNRISYADYAQKAGELSQREREINAAIQQNQNLLKNHATVIVSTAGSYQEMNAAVLQLEKRYKDLSKAQREGVPGKEILGQIDKLKNELKSIDAEMGNYQRNVGNYMSAWNGVDSKIQSITRSLPSLSAGTSSFFTQLSRNLPMMISQIKEASNEVKALREQGVKVPPVWKQLIGSLFSWQTMLVAGIAAITIYRKEIINFVKGLFNAKKTIDEVSVSTKELNKEFESTFRGVGSKIVNIKKLSDSWKSLGENIDLQKKFLKENRKELDDTGISIKTIGDAENLLVENTSAYIESMKLRAQADAARNLAAKEYEKAFQKQLELEEEAKKGPSFWEIFLETFTKGAMADAGTVLDDASVSAENFHKARIKEGQAEVDQSKKTGDAYSDLFSTILEGFDNIRKSAGFTPIIPKDTDKEAESHKNYMIRIENELAKTRASIIDQEKENEIESVRAKYQQRLSIIKGNEPKELELRKAYKEAEGKEIEAINEKYARRIELANTENRIAAIREGSEEELDLRLKLLNIQEQQEKESAEKTGLDVSLIIKKYARLREKTESEFASKRIDKMQESFASESIIMDSLLSDELSQLAKQYSEGLIDKEEYEKKRVEITKRYAIKNAEAAIQALEIQYEAEKEYLSPDERVAMERKIAKAKIALQNMVTSNLVDNVKDREEAEREWLDNMAKNIETVAESLNGFANLGSALFDRRIQEIEAEQKANQDAHDADIERIERLAETGAISTEEAEARKRAAEDKSAQKEAELAKKKAELQTRQAKLEKANNIVQIMLNTAAGIMKTIATVGFPAATPLIVLASALGAIQLATAIATPIPKYAKGTKDHGGGLAIVGDGGRSETVITPPVNPSLLHPFLPWWTFQSILWLYLMP